ncbi:TonB-dependent receptor domain-containing protein [Sphingopyxis sp. JAI128]|uniref:TonB-dependent receptor domain-containing protein n=1 Tax=Sphingopyxis sp. JAI128 TaxID=2723066 RepID=UPI00161D37A7|nr:TonB-dependent receptor [Sphingopyxis sp. JAI128]MBB6425046.1 outer membrane receptor protein involved in Fe transport [Sphingopyxis sp. JAI128]
MRFQACNVRKILLSGAAIGCLALSPTAASAREQTTNYRIPAQPLDRALRDFGVQSGVTIMVDASLVNGKRTAGHSRRSDPETALQTLLRGTGLSYRRDGNIFVVTREGNVNRAVGPEIEDNNEIVVTAQKREEKINDVPIAVTAFTPKALDDHKIEGGAELVRAVPNVNFSKSNFSGYDFTIRGIGTKAISASNDPAVAVSFNNTPLIRNRLFEAEFFDLERVEVLRGPQGTLYGRNATAGVVNVIPALPDDNFGGELKGEVGSFETRRLSGMLNVPITDTLAVRVAGAMTKREGFDYNTFTQQRVNGRDLWSTRASIQWEPSDRFKINAIWQHFEEDDNRSRTGKQLCTTDPGVAQVGDIAVPEFLQSRFSQGCQSASLYEDAAFGAPNAKALAYVMFPQFNIGIGRDPTAPPPRPLVFPIDRNFDPYGDVVQSRDMREIATSYDPVFRAKNDVFQLNMEIGIGDDLTLVSQGAYSRDRYYSSQDYNRFVSAPVFNDSAALVRPNGAPMTVPGPTPGGIFTDPQLGASDRIISADLSRSRNRQWTQELRLQSSSDGPVNFNVGANYLDFKSQDDYFVYNNLFSLIAQYNFNGSNVDNGRVTRNCGEGTPTARECVYVDPNPIGEGPEDGHNYFRSKNPVRTKSQAVFGELYWQAAEDLKLTLGLRYTRDEKIATPVPSQLLLGSSENDPTQGGSVSGGTINRGFREFPDIRQKWNTVTGRLVVDWKPDLSFTDDTLVYASAARGYKGGGANPPRADIDQTVIQYQPLPETFKPEYVTAFEIGTKNSFDGGRFTLNAAAFFNAYQDYQISQIVDRISLNENFSAKTWGLELETAWRPSRNFRLDATLGLLDTRIDKGAKSIDVMDRTQGNPDWMLLRPWLQVPSNCIAPTALVGQILNYDRANEDLKLLMLSALCAGSARYGTFNPELPNVSPAFQFDRLLGFTYNPLTDAPNGGKGFFADLGGNELPNAPHYTFNVGAQYSAFIEGGDWVLTFRGDYYRQGKSYARVFNTEYDRLKAWDNVNLAVTLARGDGDFALQLYVKNLFDKAPITGTFTNSDDTGLSTNVFTLDPRIVGLNATVKF